MGLIAGIFGILFIIFRVVIGAGLFLFRAHVTFARHLFASADSDAFVKPQTKRQ